MSNLDETIVSIKGVGVKTKALLEKLGIFTKSDLLQYFPRTYDKYGEIISIRDLKAEMIGILHAAPVSHPLTKLVGNKKIIIAEVYDGSGKMELSWFNMPYIKFKLSKGVHCIFRGKVVRKGKSLTIVQPEILTMAEYRMKQQVLQPIYPLTKGVTSNFLKKCLREILGEIGARIDYLPITIKKEYGLIGLKDAIEEIHFPKSYSTLVEARKRLVFDEFFLFSLSIDKMKKEKSKEVSKFLFSSHNAIEEFLSTLSFSMTKAQQRTWNEVKDDMRSGSRMNRLIQGDVGSGKTLIAILACLLTVKNGCQASLMVPTEVLARQHYESFSSALTRFGVKIVLLTGSIKGKERKEILSLISSGEAGIIIGTHALIQDKVEYKNLALVITDEQHRFGVRQREKFVKKGEEPHVMVMSATPIPRTLAIILYGDLDISLVDELPAERLPIKNCVVDEGYRNTSFHFIKEEVEKGHQAYVICPMVEQSEENTDLEDVISYSERLKEYYEGKIKVQYLHGKLKNEEKNLIMESFSKGEIDVLVSTTVVEVGVNVPNATVMMIENADRFGLASLHQLRGRIGRGGFQSYCIFMSKNSSQEAIERLMILKNSNDGFKIAEEDLKMRGSGDIFGIRQSGEMLFALGDVLRDADILKMASEVIKSLSDKSKNECYDRGRIFYHKSFIYGNEINTL